MQLRFVFIYLFYLYFRLCKNRNINKEKSDKQIHKS